MGLTKEEMDSEIIKDVCKDILEGNKEELRKALLDQLITAESIIHQKEDGTIRAIDPMSPEGCEIHLKYLSDNQVMEADVEFTQKDINTALENFKPKRNFTYGTGKEGYIDYERALMEKAKMDEKSINIKVERLREELPEGTYIIGDWDYGYSK